MAQQLRTFAAFEVDQCLAPSTRNSSDTYTDVTRSRFHVNCLEAALEQLISIGFGSDASFYSF